MDRVGWRRQHTRRRNHQESLAIQIAGEFTVLRADGLGRERTDQPERACELVNADDSSGFHWHGAQETAWQSATELPLGILAESRLQAVDGLRAHRRGDRPARLQSRTRMVVPRLPRRW